MEHSITEIYDKITKYYEFSDNLIKEIEDSASSSVDSSKKAQILLPVAREIKQTADKLIEEYFHYLKDENASCTKAIKKLIDELIEKIEYCKTKVYDLYRQN